MIGEGHDEALLCLTDYYQFFNESDDLGDIGHWYFPNGSTTAQGTESDSDIYATEGLGVVGLNRRSNTFMPIGTFRCDILDSNKTNQSIYVNVVHYPEDMSTSSSPTTTVKAGIDMKSGAAVGGAVAGGLLLMTAGTALVMFAIWRYKLNQ